MVFTVTSSNRKVKIARFYEILFTLGTLQNVCSGPGLTHKNLPDYGIEMYGSMYVRILTIGMGVFDMYLVLCAALHLHELSIRCFIMLSTNDFH